MKMIAKLSARNSLPMTNKCSADCYQWHLIEGGVLGTGCTEKLQAYVGLSNYKPNNRPTTNAENTVGTRLIIPAR